MLFFACCADAISEKLQQPWSASAAISLLTPAAMKEVEKRWSELDVSARMRVIYAMTMIRPAIFNATIDSWKSIIKCCLEDSDEWIRVTAALLSEYPETGAVAANVPSDAFNECVTEMTDTCMSLF